ncbi:MAG TPA: PHP domain-containing protein [Actinotalea sp.]|nr:PHP domain-containing protein [Actinotalea sp.]
MHRIAFLLEREQASPYRSKGYRTAGDLLRDLPDDQWERHRVAGTWQELPGVGASTARVVQDVLAARVPTTSAELELRLTERLAGSTPAGRELRAQLRGDLHTHTSQSDGATPLGDMAVAAVGLGHGYLAVTDHSPRLTVAHGLTADRLRAQVALIRRTDAVLAPFRLLTGIEVDILDDGSLDQEPGLLAELDVVVASVHSKLRMPGAEMTRRMLAAVRDPHTDVLGHCTGRRVLGRQRPPSEFDPLAVFAACVERGVAVEVNSRPDRRDPPDELLDVAVTAGCLFAVDSDAHAPGQLDWQVDGCDRLAALGIGPDRVVNAWPVDRLLAWTGRHRRQG